jgi:hypothetical protein
MDQHTPFGYRFQGDICNIKLRFKEDKFMEAGLNKFGNYRYSKNNFIIFEITISTKSDDYKELTSKLNSLRTSK